MGEKMRNYDSPPDGQLERNNKYKAGRSGQNQSRSSDSSIDTLKTNVSNNVHEIVHSGSRGGGTYVSQNLSKSSPLNTPKDLTQDKIHNILDSTNKPTNVDRDNTNKSTYVDKNKQQNTQTSETAQSKQNQSAQTKLVQTRM